MPGIEDHYVAGNPRWSGHDRLVVLSGCSGGGKSALLAELAARGHQVFLEPGRQVVKEEALIGGTALPWVDMARFGERCIARATYFFNVADASEGPVFFDRGIIDAVTALERVGPLPAAAAEAARRYRYGRRVFLVPPWAELFARDTERQHGFESAVAEYDALVESYARHGYEPEQVPRGSVSERADFVEATLAEGAR